MSQLERCQDTNYLEVIFKFSSLLEQDEFTKFKLRCWNCASVMVVQGWKWTMSKYFPIPINGSIIRLVIYGLEFKLVLCWTLFVNSGTKPRYRTIYNKEKELKVSVNCFYFIIIFTLRELRWKFSEVKGIL